MGCDIHGWVEVRRYPDWAPQWWTAVADAGALLDRDYDIFGCLFGVRNYAQFRAVTAKRGLPDGLSERAKADYGDEAETDYHSATWVGWDELTRLDPDEPAERDDERINEYERVGDEWRCVAKFAGSSELSRHLREHPDEAGAREWHIEGHLYRRERMTRRGALTGPAWEMFSGVCTALAARYGAENVRIVCWFDN